MAKVIKMLQANGTIVEKVWLKPEPDSKERRPYLRFTNRYGKSWLIPLAD